MYRYTKYDFLEGITDCILAWGLDAPSPAIFLERYSSYTPARRPDRHGFTRGRVCCRGLGAVSSAPWVPFHIPARVPPVEARITEAGGRRARDRRARPRGGARLVVGRGEKDIGLI